MIKTTLVFALAMTALGIGAFTSQTTQSKSSKTVLVASGGSNCPVYYGCPTPPPTQKGGANSGGVNAGGGNTGGGSGSASGSKSPAPGA